MAALRSFHLVLNLTAVTGGPLELVIRITYDYRLETYLQIEYELLFTYITQLQLRRRKESLRLHLVNVT
jgi:hypothetical protein